MRHRVSAGIFGVLVAVAAVGCSSEEVPDVGNDAFSVMPTNGSLLKNIASTNGDLSVCIALVDSPADADSWRERAVANIDHTVNAWNALLQDNPWWSVPTVTPRYTFVNGRQCSGGSATLKVNIWSSISRFKNEWCAGQPECASSANPATRTFGLGPWNRTVEDDPLDPFTTLHEYGHLLSLGDTYQIPGYNTWIGEQPPSVMNGMSSELTDDDKLGLWAALNAINTGRRSCDGFGRPNLMSANYWSSILCDTRSVSIDTHGNVIIQVGPIEEDLLNAAETVTVVADQLNCRSYAGTEYPAVSKVRRGQQLTTSVIDGKSRIQMASDGTPWIHIAVDGDYNDTDCYVSARYEYIMPKGDW